MAYYLGLALPMIVDVDNDSTVIGALGRAHRSAIPPPTVSISPSRPCSSASSPGSGRARSTGAVLAASAIVAALAKLYVPGAWYIVHRRPRRRRGRGDPACRGRRSSPMSFDRHHLLAIVGMALATYATRVAGLYLMRGVAVKGRLKAALDALPPAILMAVIAPTILATGMAETHCRGASRPARRCCACRWSSPSSTGVVERRAAAAGAQLKRRAGALQASAARRLRGRSPISFSTRA